MKKFISLCIVASLIVFSGTALAADKPVSDQGSVEKGKRQKSDKPRLKFEDCDKGNTGALTFEEAQACFPRMSQKRFDAIDTNQDGKITKEELKASYAARKKNKKAKKIAE
jgi:Ca2+-binding EF-hand superfamily protein